MMRKCFLTSKRHWEKSIPEVGREKLRAAEEEMGCVCLNHSHGDCRSTCYSWFLLISFYVSARSLKRVMEN